jgi:hypothetical protein
MKVVWAGTKLTFSGKVTARAAAGAQVPLADVPLELDRATSYGWNVALGTTKSDGTYAFTVTASGGGEWDVVLDQKYPYPWNMYNENSSQVEVVCAQSRTRIVSFAAKNDATRKFKVFGIAQAFNGSSWEPANGLSVDIYYQNSMGNWVHDGTAPTNAWGGFGFYPQHIPTGVKGWQGRLARQYAPDGGIYLASRS